MPIFSTAAVDWSDFEPVPPQRTTFLAIESRIDLLFGEFAKFLRAKISRSVRNDTDTANINQNDELLDRINSIFFVAMINDNAVPSDPNGGLILVDGIADNNSFFDSINVYFSNLATDQQKFLFQYYLYLGLYHFAVWYLCEKKCCRNAAVAYKHVNWVNAKLALFDFAMTANFNPSTPTGVAVRIKPSYDSQPVSLVYDPSSETLLDGSTKKYNCPVRFHAFYSDVRDVVTDKVKWKLKCKRYDISSSFYESYYYRRCFSPELYINDLISPNCLGILTKPLLCSKFKVTRHTGSSRSPKEKVDLAMEGIQVRRVMVEAFHDSITDIVEEEMQWLVSQLGPALSESYGSIRFYGVGDGTETKGLFGLDNYGLCFVKYDLTADGAGVEPAIANVNILMETDSPRTNASVLYYGLDNNFVSKRSEAPKISFTAVGIGNISPASRQCLKPEMCFLLKETDKKLPIGRYPDLPINFADNNNKPMTLNAMLSSSGGQGGLEELVYIIFKYSTPPVPVLVAENLFGTDDFRVDPASSLQFFTQGNAPQALEAMILALKGANNFTFTVNSNLAGRGVGQKTPATGAINTVVSAEVQKDNKDNNDPALRRATASIYVSPDPAGLGMRISFDVAGYVSPSPCSWATWTSLSHDQKQDAKTFFGDHLRKSENNEPIYNPALSAMRAFAMLDAVTGRIVAAATAMVANGDITAADLTIITNTLNAHVQTEAAARMSQPGTSRIPQAGPLVRRSRDDQDAARGVGGLKDSIVYIDFKLFNLLKYW
ncbi:hypothetical protein [Asticcacaulis sp. AC402]|uniref:hypothetical protein n=1 Tax=Asticcacaulis sp. AC402 TaxID=1282361 RepID=UPI0004CE9179|nr:hypothetical protein [Asticcacaulis sp. AC402]